MDTAALNLVIRTEGMAEAQRGLSGLEMPNITGTNALQGGPRLAPGASFSLRG